MMGVCVVGGWACAWWVDVRGGWMGVCVVVDGKHRGGGRERHEKTGGP